MKRITTLVLAVAFALGSVSAAFADGIDVKVKGQWDFNFGWVSGGDFRGNVHGDRQRSKDDKFNARQRVRTQVNFITNEWLQGVLMFEIGNLNWGRPGTVGRGSGGSLDGDGVNVETKFAYLDWIIPYTEITVRMGLQRVALPSTPMGAAIFHADVAGIVVSSPITDWLSATAFWLRPFDQYGNDTESGFGRDLSDEVDIFGLVLPVKGDGWAVTPWGMYGFIGANSGFYDYIFNERNTNSYAIKSRAKGWWLGTLFELTMFDPLSFSMEVDYGRLSKANLGGTTFDPGTGGFVQHSNWASTQGWFIAATLDYKLDWGTPGIFGWWASGDGQNAYDSGKLGRIPMLGVDDGFCPTTFGTAGNFGISDGGYITNTGAGTWGVGIQLAEVSFIEDLKHTLRFAYYKGTNHEDNVKGNGGQSLYGYGTDALYLTRKDHVFEVNFDHEYMIYENLTAVLELGWLHLKSDKTVWGNRRKDENSNAWKAEISFQYKF